MFEAKYRDKMNNFKKIVEGEDLAQIKRLVNKLQEAGARVESWIIQAVEEADQAA
jgi:hypothetical protein